MSLVKSAHQTPTSTAHTHMHTWRNTNVLIYTYTAYVPSWAIFSPYSLATLPYQSMTKWAVLVSLCMWQPCTEMAQ